MRIVLCYPVEPHHIDQIQAAAPDAEIVDAGQERIDEELPNADIFIGHAKVPVDWKRVVDAGRLKWIQSSAAGLDHCLVPEVIPTDIVVTSAAGLFAPQVTEQTFALLYGLLRRIPTFFRAQAKREFIRRPTDDLRGKTVGIVGFGGNGRAIAKGLAPMDVRILATDYYPVDAPSYVDALWSADRLPDLLAASDIVILALPLNSSTLGLINREMLALMPKDSYLINVARGQVVVEADLVQALQSGHLQGAGLDVTEREPLPEQSPLWEMPQVMITPHVGAQSARRVSDSTDLACENLRRYQNGRPLWNRVDKTLGFAHPNGVFRGNIADDPACS
ncbi:Glycerate dehydrogenase [Roseimaritima multifibrata]|uniref:Glycerate dehydrogenase n=1 Tax=Roseimaritima multifibrata TaxID=1930274 RepID=A0A517MFU1_9BACT|nr:D-2-hydroxyacid dehydrogenase [Roseimaritima multifibrata]QDS93627.1 Glycerate dehydrogenase [Roseimaritima multifibrata]